MIAVIMVIIKPLFYVALFLQWNTMEDKSGQ